MKQVISLVKSVPTSVSEINERKHEHLNLLENSFELPKHVLGKI